MTQPAQAEAYLCGGGTPDWTLRINQDNATFDFIYRNQFDIPQRSIAEGRDWPRALSLIAEFDTAIVVLDRAVCGADPIRAHILTQRGQTPILLSGCCEILQ